MKKLFTSIIVFFLIFQMSIMSVAAANSIDFKDVPKNSYGYTEIMSLKERGFINGYLDGTYKPSTEIKRAHIAALLDRSLDLKPIRPAIEFKDVPKTHPYYHEIQNVYRAGIIDGDQGNFKPNSVLTRVQLSKILNLAFDFKLEKGFTFSDVPKNHWGTDYISTLHHYKIMPGTNGKFSPSGPVTRADYAVFLYRALDVKETVTTNPTAFSKRADEIQTQWNQLKPRHQGKILTIDANAAQPYQLGQVHQQALKDAVNLTNFFRYISYMPSDITLNEAFNKEAQAASLVNAVNQQMTHTPNKPVGMDQALFDLGYKGASTSNIGVGYKDIPDSIVRGYMSDNSNQNRIDVGHRRWVLSPQLKDVGFGFAYDTTDRGHTAMKIVSDDLWKNPMATYDRISWPAETAFPTNFFNDKDPWSVSLNENTYDMNKLGNVQVTLTRKSDNQKWRFARNSQTDGFFNIATNSNYGQTPVTIIFQPKNIAAYTNGDVFQVDIQNVYQKDGQKTNITFETTFFDLK